MELIYNKESYTVVYLMKDVIMEKFFLTNLIERLALSFHDFCSLVLPFVGLVRGYTHAAVL